MRVIGVCYRCVCVCIHGGVNVFLLVRTRDVRRHMHMCVCVCVCVCVVGGGYQSGQHAHNMLMASRYPSLVLRCCVCFVQGTYVDAAAALASMSERLRKQEVRTFALRKACAACPCSQGLIGVGLSSSGLPSRGHMLRAASGHGLSSRPRW